MSDETTDQQRADRQPTLDDEALMTLKEMAPLLGYGDDATLAWLDRQGVPRYDLNSRDGRPLARKAAVRVRRRDFLAARERCRVGPAPAASPLATDAQPLKRPPGYVPRHFDAGDDCAAPGVRASTAASARAIPLPRPSPRRAAAASRRTAHATRGPATAAG